MPDAVMRAIDVLRINAIQLAHPPGKIAFDGLHHDLIMVSHQGIGMADPIEPLADGTQDVEPGRSIGVSGENRFALVAARRNMVQGAGKLDP